MILLYALSNLFKVFSAEMSSTEEVYGIDGEDSNDDGGDDTFLKT